MIHHITRATRHLLFWGLILTALLLSGARVFLASIDQYQAELEQKIRRITDIPLHFGQIEAGLRGFNPEVILKNISIEANVPGNQPDVRLREIRLGFNFWDLLLTHDWLSSSRVTLVGARLNVTRQADGSISIKGLQASEGQPLWLLQGGQYEILDSEIFWRDLKRNGETVHFDRFDLVLKNRSDSHELHLLSNLPPEYGHDLRISALFTGNIFQPGSIQGRLYIEGSDLQATALVTGDLPLGLDLQSGAGDIRVWSLWHDSTPYRIMGYIQAQQISISKNQAKALHMDTFEGNFDWSDRQGRWRLSGYDVNIFTHHQRWPNGAFNLQQDAQGNLSAVIKQLDLPAAMFLAPLFIPGDAQGGTLKGINASVAGGGTPGATDAQGHAGAMADAAHDDADWLKLNPSGRLLDVSVYASQDFQHYAARGRFEALGIDHFAAFPQLRGLSGSLGITDHYGQISLDSHDVVINAENWFRNPLTVKRLQGKLQWWQDAESWRIFSRNLIVDSADFETVSDLNLLIGKSGAAAAPGVVPPATLVRPYASPVLDLRTRFGQFADISHVPRYLPAKIMDAGAVDWLDNAFVAGQVTRGELLIQGALDQFPFGNGQGRFETVFAMENAEIQFNRDWPHLRDVYADVQFLGPDLQVGILEGGSEKVEIEQAVVTIPALADSENVYVWGQVRAQVMDSLAFLQKSPLKAKISPMTKLIGSEADTRVDLDLKLPYSLADPLKVNVNAHLNDAQLVLKPINLKIDNIKGVLNFTEDRMASERIDARALGYPIQGRLSSDERANYLNVEGSTSIDQLEKQFPFLQNTIAKGVFPYTASLTLPYAAKQPGLLRINSSLQGVGIDGWMDLAKTAEAEKPLNLSFQFDETAMLPLALQYGDQLHALFLIDKTRDNLYSGHIVFGQGQAGRYEQAGLKLDIQQPVFNLSQALAAMGAGDEADTIPAIQEISLDTGQLLWQGQALGALQCRLQHKEQHWQGTINSEMAKGHFKIPDQRGGNDRIDLRMEYLNLSAMDKFSFESADEVINDLPLVDIDSRQLLWRGMDLGVLKLQAKRVVNGIHFDKFQLSGAKSKIDLTADWLKQPAADAQGRTLKGINASVAQGTTPGATSTTLVQGTLKADDFGQLLTQLNFSDDIKETTADITFKGGWRGGPHQFSLGRLNGQLQLELKDGRISSIEPGFGRLLGLIAMEQWVKRLSLDFSDIYRQGLAFDDIKGRFSIRDGLAYTEDLTVNGVAATFNIAGFVNLADKTVDQRVAVVPKSSDALPIAGTIVSGVAGLITRVVTNDYEEGYFLGSKYQLSGNWGNVEVTPLHDEDGLLNKTWRGLTNFDWLVP